MNPNDRTTDSLPISRRTVIINSGLAAAAIAGLSSCTMRPLRTASLLPPPAVHNTFGSKEALVRAHLEERHAGTTGRLTAAIASTETPRDRILTMFAAQAELFAQPDFHGCAFVAAASEAPRGGLVEQAADEYRAWILGMFRDLAADAGAADPNMLATQLQLIYDGAGLAARMDRRPDAAVSARAAVNALLDAQLPATTR